MVVPILLPRPAMTLSVVIPAYNEARTIAELIARVRSIPIVTEVVVVDDCSSDGTWDVLKRLAEPGVVVLHHERNAGKGAALRTGFKAATGDVVIIQDADLE